METPPGPEDELAVTTEADLSASTLSFDGGVRANLKEFVGVLRQGDDASLERAVVQLSKLHRWLAPVALIVGAVLMLFQGLKLLFANWRLTLVQVLPAMWIWVAMIDLKAHVLHGHSFHVLRGWVLIPLILAIAGITAASFYLNAVFAFAISRHGGKEIRPAFAEARVHLRVVLAWGLGIGLMLGFATIVTSRWGRWPFTIAMSIVVAIMMICYLAVPARLIGISPQANLSRRDKLTATRHRRRVGSGGLLTALPAGPARHPVAGFLLRARTHPADHRAHTAGRGHQRREVDQDERQAGLGYRHRVGRPARRRRSVETQADEPLVIGPPDAPPGAR